MRLLWILLPILSKGASGNWLSIPPASLSVVRQGQSLSLYCVSREKLSQCIWKVGKTDFALTGFFTTSIPANLDITARDPGSTTDCTITFNNIDSRYDGVYTCSVMIESKGGRDAEPSVVVVARKPTRVHLVDGVTDGYRLEAIANQPESVTCQADSARPKAEITWYLDNSQLYDGVTTEDKDDPGSELVTSRSTLRHQFSKADNGARLRCVANHPGYDEGDNREASTLVDVQYIPYRPEGNNIGKIYGFTADQTGVVIVNFTANPAPIDMSWKVADNVVVAAGGQSLDKRFTARTMETINQERGMYALALVIEPVLLSDQATRFRLQLANSVGSAALEFTIGTGEAPPPAVLSGATIIAIIVAVVLLLLIVGLVAFGRSRGKWCFAADPEAANNRLRKADKADVEAEKADNKDEARELTKSDGDAADGDQPAKKSGEVVYAELQLNSDGVKTEVRPSADKTEYAVIVPPRQEATNAANDSKE